MSLVKITGRDVVTVQKTGTRQVWVNDPVTPPPVTPPVTPPVIPPVTPPVNVPFGGPTLIPCVNAAGQSGMMVVLNNANGTFTRISGCMVSNGLN